jgi:hypothetical protein
LTTCSFELTFFSSSLSEESELELEEELEELEDDEDELEEDDEVDESSSPFFASSRESLLPPDVSPFVLSTSTSFKA